MGRSRQIEVKGAGAKCPRLYLMDRQKIFDLALKVFLFLSPLFTFRTMHLSFARAMFFVLGSFVLFAIALGCKQKRPLNNVWVSPFLLLAFVRIFFDNNLL